MIDLDPNAGRRPYRSASVAVALALALWCAPVQGQDRPVDRAFAAYEAGELDVALELFDAALRAPDNEPSELLIIHLHLGVLLGATGQDEAARRSFAAALALDPELEAPPELGGELRQWFIEQRASRVEAMSVEAQAPPDLATGRTVTLQVEVHHAPEGLVESLRLRIGESDEGWSLTIGGQGPSPVAIPAEAWPAEGSATLVIEALDEHGGVLARTEVMVPPREDGPEAIEEGGPDEGDEPRPWYHNPWLWVGLGVLVAGGVTVGVVLGTAEDQYILGAPRVR